MKFSGSMFSWIVTTFGFFFLSELEALPIEDTFLPTLDVHSNSIKNNQKISERGLISLTPYLKAARFRLTCASCRPLFHFIETHINLKTPDEDIEAMCVSLCVSFQISTQVVCEGVIPNMVKESLYIIRMSGIDSKDICGFLIGGDCEPPGFEDRFNWELATHPNQKPPVTPLKPPQSNESGDVVNTLFMGVVMFNLSTYMDGLPTKRILHLSDTHMDPYYQEGSNADCDLPLCCRSSVGLPDKPSDAAGKWGDHRQCDPPPRTVEHMLSHIVKEEGAKIDYIIWTGDLAPHDGYNQTKEGKLEQIKFFHNLLSKYFPKTPIYPSLGNHESVPVNSFPQPDISDPAHSIAWLYNEVSKTWPKLMQQDANFGSSDTIIKGGYYSVLVEPGFRIISLNMNYGNNQNYWILRDSVDPASQLAWLNEELVKAEAKGEKVHLLGHEPPGNDYLLKIWSRNMRQIINRFENTITAQFYGHTHCDELILFYDDDMERATSIAYVGPSITSFANLNPGYKIYTLDGDYAGSTRMVLDGEGYYMNLTEANLHGEPDWKKLYSYKDAYDMRSLTPTDWSNFVKRMKTDDAMLRKFFKHFHRDSETFPSCDSKCAHQLICRQVTSVAFDHSVCKHMGVEASTSLFKTPGDLYYDFPSDC